MAELIKLNIAVVLRHILDSEPKLIQLGDSDSSESEEGEEEEEEDYYYEGSDLSDEFNADNNPMGTNNNYLDNNNNNNILNHRLSNVADDRKKQEEEEGGEEGEDKNEKKSIDLRRKSNLKKLKERKRKSIKSTKSYNAHLGSLLDFNGPKLIEGCKSWLLFYQIVGQINWIGKPLYLSIIYKVLLNIILIYNLMIRFIWRFYKLNILNENYRNPIFLLFNFLAILVSTALVILNFKINLFDLCPIFKILTTPKLCFIKTKVQHVIGSKTLTFMLLFHIYHGLIFNMLLFNSFNDFITEFNILTFIFDLYIQIVGNYQLIGISYLDLYIRTAFGHWLLALKSHLEHRFTHLHKNQRQFQLTTANSGINSSTMIIDSNDVISNNSFFSKNEQFIRKKSTINLENKRKSNPPLISFDEIQRNLNNMDDHLEVMRSIQIPTLVLLSLIAFLGNGALFLLTYRILADQANTYHGFLLLIISCNYIVIIFFCYSGDRWLYYALSSFVQTVEDEYFMQSDVIKPTNNNTFSSNEKQQKQLILDEADLIKPIAPLAANFNQQQQQADYSTIQQTSQMLLIRKKDVLFCHEFLHQFENHLATPWSEFTFKTHLHTLRTFVTLIAAQIIFDHEH